MRTTSRSSTTSSLRTLSGPPPPRPIRLKEAGMPTVSLVEQNEAEMPRCTEAGIASCTEAGITDNTEAGIPSWIRKTENLMPSWSNT